MRKIIGVIIAVTGALLFIGGVCVLAYDIYGLSQAGVLTVRDIIGTFPFAGACLVGLLIVEPGMRIFDGDYTLRGDGYGFGRWTMNVMFSGFVAVFVMELGLFTTNHPAGYTNAVIFILVILVSGAMLVYIRDYRRQTDKRRRIRALMKAGCLNSDRRFYMLNEETVSDKKNNATVLCGFLHGEIRLNDRVLLFVPGLKPALRKVIRLRCRGKNVKRAGNQPIGVYLEGYEEKEAVPRFAKLTGVALPVRAENRVNAENPVLVTDIGEYASFAGDEVYLSQFLYNVCHGTYLVPAQSAKEVSDPTAVMARDDVIGFPGVSTRFDNSLYVLPIYTDWDALSRWRGINGATDHYGAIAMSFSEVASLAQKGFDGFVINPFGPAPFFMNDDFIRKVKDLPGYREEFGGAKINKEDEEDEQKI